MESSNDSIGPPRGKKSKRNPEKWKRNVAKRKRYSSKGLPELPTCGHNIEHFKCTQLQMTDLLTFHDDFYKNIEKAEQDSFILKYCSPHDTKRRRPLNYTRNRKIYHTNFTIPQGNIIIPVCQQTFVKTLGITKHRVGFLMKNFFESGEIPAERRGGDRNNAKFLIRVESILNFLKKLESSMCYSDESLQVNMLTHMNINRLCRIYNVENPNVPVTLHYFRNTYKKYCNLGFIPTEKEESFSDYSE